jgi:hypothetical protein
MCILETIAGIEEDEKRTCNTLWCGQIVRRQACVPALSVPSSSSSAWGREDLNKERHSDVLDVIDIKCCSVGACYTHEHTHEWSTVDRFSAELLR